MASAAAPDTAGDSAFETSLLERPQRGGPVLGVTGWRLQLLLLLVLATVSLLLLLSRQLAQQPHLDGRWQLAGAGAVQWAPQPRLADKRAAEWSTVLGLTAAGVPTLAADPAWLQRSARWQTDDALRQHQQDVQLALVAALEQPVLDLQTAGGAPVPLAPSPRGWAGLGLNYYGLVLLAGVLALLALGVLLARPKPSNTLFALLCACQSGNLLFVAAHSLPGLGLPAWLITLDWPLRSAFDLATVAALVHVYSLHPRRLPNATLLAAGAWGLAALAWGVLQTPLLPSRWAWLQGLCLLMAGLALLIVGRASRREPNPFAALLQRLTAVALGSAALVTAVLAAGPRQAVESPQLVGLACTVWSLLPGCLLLSLPFLLRSKQLLRELALLAAVASIAVLVHMALVAGFMLTPLMALMLAVLLTLAPYALARAWILRRLLHTGLSTERTFEQLYRAARSVQAQPARRGALMAQLLRDMFEPLELQPLQQAPSRARVVAGGEGLVVPVKDAAALDDTGTGGGGVTSNPGPAALHLRFAQRGRRLFTEDDARLAERVVDQLRRAVAYDRAVARGRNEERLRIAQDLHDDIGARLLTLMYQAPNAEMENYLRHTLQDLKTLTRGLAAAEHRLSHAAGEWKADLAQRLATAGVELGWSFSADRDLRLTVVQWSALTRVLRELASNTMAHGQATRLDVQFNLHGRQLLLLVSDDGLGRNPLAWSHGLGLGGVRKRVKLLGGTVVWREGVPRGIVCEVRVPEFAPTR
jgi:signal transduction histidine kinase